MNDRDKRQVIHKIHNNTIENKIIIGPYCRTFTHYGVETSELWEKVTCIKCLAKKKKR